MEAFIDAKVPSTAALARQVEAAFDATQEVILGNVFVEVERVEKSILTTCLTPIIARLPAYQMMRIIAAEAALLKGVFQQNPTEANAQAWGSKMSSKLRD